VTATTVRALNAAGIERFRAYLELARAGVPADPPLDLLADPACTAELSAEVHVEPMRFATRWRAGEYLWQKLAALAPEEVEGNRGLWAWLALYWFEQLAPRRADGTRRPGRDYRHVPDFGFRYRYRHLLYGPFAVYRRHRGHAILVLSGPLHVEPGVYQEITSRQDLVVSRGVIEALNALYLDRSRGLPKRGSQGREDHPGTLRRFVRVLQQLDLTYDIYGMPGSAIVELLPPEFDAWRSGRATLF
jgi:hypothetical protein